MVSGTRTSSNSHRSRDRDRRETLNQFSKGRKKFARKERKRKTKKEREKRTRLARIFSHVQSVLDISKLLDILSLHLLGLKFI